MMQTRLLVLLAAIIFENGYAQLQGSLASVPSGSLSLGGGGGSSGGSSGLSGSLGGGSLGLGGSGGSSKSGGSSGGSLNLGGSGGKSTLGGLLELGGSGRSLNSSTINTTVKNSTVVNVDDTIYITETPEIIKTIRYEEEIRKTNRGGGGGGGNNNVIVKKPKKPKQPIGYMEIIKTVRYEEDYVSDRKVGSKITGGGRTTDAVKKQVVKSPARKVVRYEEGYADSKTMTTGGNKINPCRDIVDDNERKKCRQERNLG